MGSKGLVQEYTYGKYIYLAVPFICLWLGEFQLGTERTFTWVSMNPRCMVLSGNLHSPGGGMKKLDS